MSASADADRDDTAALRDRLGVCQWFHYEAYEDVEMAVEQMRALGVRHLRTGISWADFHRPGGKRWYDWQMAQLDAFDVLVSVWHTPPSIAAGSTCASPPRRLQDYADFIGQVIDEYGGHFESVELWNEPNNRLKWDFPRFDPSWRLFGAMVREAALVARARGKPAVLGGMIPVDPHWLELMRRYGVLDTVDAVAIHGFPDMWWPDRPNWDWYAHWHGWTEKIRSVADPSGLPVWITETGLATWDMRNSVAGRFQLQARRLEVAAQAPAERVYWYSLVDLHPARDAIEGFHVDENEYHLGLSTWKGVPKPAWRRMRQLLRERTRAAPGIRGA
jgi:CDP-paratose 2-epimerase